jgi:hypothetical protein
MRFAWLLAFLVVAALLWQTYWRPASDLLEDPKTPTPAVGR